MNNPHYITESNDRCRQSGMDPQIVSQPRQFLRGEEFAEKQRAYSEILSVVSFFSNKLLDTLQGTPILVVVSDADGYLLSIEGDETIKSLSDRFGIIPGALFTIEDTGTNVVSLALQQMHPVSLIGEQHYHDAFHDIACYGMAIRNIEEDRVLGSISMMMPVPFQNPLFLPMLVQAVDTIERELQLRRQNRQLDIMNQIMLKRTHNAIVITDSHGNIFKFNEFAVKLSDGCGESLMGKNIFDFPLLGKYFKEVLENGVVVTNEEVIFEDIEGAQVICLFDAQPIYEDGRMVGVFGQCRDISNRYFLQQQYNYLAFHDELTTLPNRRFIKQRIQAVLDDINNGRDRQMALLFIDLDRFKVINDNFGHSYGDLLLYEVSMRLSLFLGECDILARMGGDEFIFLLTDFDDREYVFNKAEEVLSAFHDPFVVFNKELHTTASIGVVFSPDPPVSMEDLLVYADNALYQAKNQGKNQFVIHTSDLLSTMVTDSGLEMDLRDALEENQFVLHYQPQIHNMTGQLIGFEALIRWQHPRLGLLPPGRFIKLAEENGLITQIGEWVINEASLQNKKWQDAGMAPVKMSVNLSTQQFLTRNLVSFVEAALERTQLNPKYFVIEITEDMAMEYDYSIPVLQQLKSLGVGISMDDFGTGYSSLSYLKNFPIDYIKIDKSFVSELFKDNSDAIIVIATITLAHNLGKEVIAEGVETQEQLDFLKSHHCDISQGYFFNKPLAKEDVERIYIG